MKRSTARWTTSLAAAALLGLPTAGLAQTSATTQPPSTSAQQPTTTPGAQPTQKTEAQEHLRQAKAALDSIAPTAVTGKAKTQLAELKRHLTALERTAGSKARGNANWGTEVAAADKILTNLLGPAGTTGSATDPTATTGTSGSTASSRSKAAAAVTLDEATRTQLMEVRTHVTAFAAAMSGTSSDASPASPSAGSTSTTGTSGSTTGSTTSSTTGSTTGATTSTAASTTSTDSAQAAAAQPQMNQDAARRHLTEARDTLSQLTQLPAAAQLSGEARTQVSQLISNFNELITTQSEWRASYTKVDANLTALLGPDSTDAAATGGVSTGTTGTGTTGTAGTSGTATGVASLDPAIRAKLVELRNKLNEFERAAGGNVTPSDAPSPAATGTSTSQTTPPQATTPQTGTPTPEMGHQEAMRHIAAIEAILNANAAGTPAAGTSGTTTGSTTGTTGSTTSSTTPSTGTGVTLTSTQLEQLRTHLAELKRLVGEAKK